MSSKEIDKQIEAYAQAQCEEIQKRRDMGLPLYSIKEAIIRDVKFGIALVGKENHVHLSLENKKAGE
jgi:hypothetical protein